MSRRVQYPKHAPSPPLVAPKEAHEAAAAAPRQTAAHGETVTQQRTREASKGTATPRHTATEARAQRALAQLLCPCININLVY